MASKKPETMLDDVVVDKAKRKTRGRSRSTLSVDAEESLQLEAKNRSGALKTRKRSRSQTRRQSVEEDDSDDDEIFRQNLFPDGKAAVACSSSSSSKEKVTSEEQQREDDSSFVSVGGAKSKRKFKRAVPGEDIRMLDKAMREFAAQSKIGMEVIDTLADIFAPGRPKDKKKVKRTDILALLDQLRESMAKGQERMIAIATNQKSFQDGVGNLLLDTLRGTMSSSSNAVPVMPIARAKQIASGGGVVTPSTQKTQNVWDDIDDLFTLMSAGRPAESVERTRFTKDDGTGNSSSTEEDEYRELILPKDSDDDDDEEEEEVVAESSSSTHAASARDYSKPGQLASAFFGLAISTKVRGRIAPPCIMTSDWLNSAVHGGVTPDGTVDPLPTILAGGGSKKSAQRRAHAYGNTTALSFRRDSNVGAGITEMSNNVRKNMMPSVML